MVLHGGFDLHFSDNEWCWASFHVVVHVPFWTMVFSGHMPSNGIARSYGASSQGYVFPVVMYGCESWTVKKAEHWRIDAFELWCWRRLLIVPWTARRSNQPILKEISPGCSLEEMMLKLKLQYFGHLMRRVDSLEKTLMLGGVRAGGEGDDRGWDGWMASWTWWTWVWVNSGSWWWTGRPGVLWFMGSQGVRHGWATVLISSDGAFISS